jgi:hypothetical protein
VCLASHVRHISVRGSEYTVVGLYVPKREEVRGDGEKLHNKEIGKFKFYSLADIIRVIELRRSKWVEHVECMGKNS